MLFQAVMQFLSRLVEIKILINMGLVLYRTVNRELKSKRRFCQYGRQIGEGLDFPKSAVRGSWKQRTFVTRKRAKFTGAFLLR